MDCSMPGFPVHHQLLELAQTHVHQVGDAIQSSHSLSSPSLVVLVDTKVLSCSVLADSLQLHGLQHARHPCPSPTPGACSDSCPSSWWCHPTISFSVNPFFSCLQFVQASGSVPMGQYFASSGQSIGASASASVLPKNIQDWFSLELLVWTPYSPRDYPASSPTPQFKSINSSVPSLWSNTHIHTRLLEKP